jgi:predicted O-linked N-acetylglucosamine transferase (SPINDLY family)
MMQGLEPEPTVGPLPALSSSVVTFGCLNVFSKLNAPLLRMWAEILGEVKRSRLLLLASEGYPRKQALEILGAEGIEAARVNFAEPRPRAEYFRLYDDVDVSLDTLPYNGHTTGLDSFWMGVPVVTMLGRTVAGRAGFSHLSNLGLNDLAGRDAKAYVEIAVSLARDLPRLSELRRTLRGRMLDSPLAEAKGFARAIESAYRQMWRRCCVSNGQPYEGADSSTNPLAPR